MASSTIWTVSGNALDRLVPTLVAIAAEFPLHQHDADSALVLNTPAGAVPGTYGAARAVARAAAAHTVTLLGEAGEQAADVENWLELVGAGLTAGAAARLAGDRRLAALVAIGVRFTADQAKAAAAALKDAQLAACLAGLDARLQLSQFLADTKGPSLADWAAAAGVYSLVGVAPALFDKYPNIMRWYGSMSTSAVFTAAVEATQARLGGLRRAGGQIDVKPYAPTVAAAADSSIALNAGQKAATSQRQQEKAAKEQPAAASAKAAPAAAAAPAGGNVLPADPSVKPTAEQPASNKGPLPTLDQGLAASQEAAARWGIEIQSVHEHAAASNMEELAVALADVPGLRCKNLALKAKKPRCEGDSRFWLAVALEDSAVDMKKVAADLGYGKVQVRFADAPTLQEHLGSQAGHVSPFALMNDTALKVNVALDSRILALEDDALVLFHPLVNTASVSISKAHLLQLIARSGHSTTIIDF